MPDERRTPQIGPDSDVLRWVNITPYHYNAAADYTLDDLRRNLDAFERVPTPGPIDSPRPVDPMVTIEEEEQATLREVERRMESVRTSDTMAEYCGGINTCRSIAERVRFVITSPQPSTHIPFCLGCGKDCLGYSFVGDLCRSCREIARGTLLQCACCGEERPYVAMLTTIDGRVCQDCTSSSYIRCSHCRQLYRSGTGRIIFHSRCCSECAEHATVCDRCDRPTLNRYHVLSGGDYINYCESCRAEHTVRCERCQAVHPEEQGACPIEIHSYNYRPETPTFHQVDGEKTEEYFGFELEINPTSGDLDDVIRWKDGKPVYLKHDGSVPDGVEIVSDPMSWKYIQESGVIDRVSDIKGFESHGFREGASFHIHVSKKAFTTFHLYKFLKFFYDPDNHSALRMIAQRTISQCHQWCSFDDHPPVKELAFDKMGSYKYCAVNLCNPDTVEVRIFRGNMRPDRLYKNLEFMRAVIDWTRDASVKDVNMVSFLQYVRTHKKSLRNLWNFMVEKSFINGSFLRKSKDQEEPTRQCEV